MTRSVPPRTSVVAKVCRRMWTVVSSSRAGSCGDAGDAVVGAPDAEALPALVEEEGGTVVGVGPVGTSERVRQRAD